MIEMRSMNGKKLEIKDTGKYGKGVFAGEDIKKGERIYTLKGTRLDVKKLVARILDGKEYIDDPLQVGKRTYIDLDNYSRLFNHSCDPNGGLRNRGELFALKDIPRGEEITYDYSATIAPTDWNMRCLCGAKNCRGVLGDVLTIPKAQMKHYLEMGGLQRYMKNIWKEIKQKGKYIRPKYEIWALQALKAVQ